MRLVLTTLEASGLVWGFLRCGRGSAQAVDASCVVHARIRFGVGRVFVNSGDVVVSICMDMYSYICNTQVKVYRSPP